MAKGKALLLALVLCLAFLTPVHAKKCALGSHWNAFASPPACVLYSDVPSNGSTDWIAPRFEAEASLLPIVWAFSGQLGDAPAGGSTLNNGARAIKIEIPTLAPRLNFKIVGKGNGRGLSALITRGGKSVAEFAVPGEVSVEFERDASWEILIVNWEQEQSSFLYESYSGSLSCAESKPMRESSMGTDGPKFWECGLPDGAADKCEYNVLGFNPWERWNLFTIPEMGNSNSGTATLLAGFTMEGRLAAKNFQSKGDGSGAPGAIHIHTKVEPYIKKSAPWSKWSMSIGPREDPSNSDCNMNLLGATSPAVFNGGIERMSGCEADYNNGIVDNNGPIEVVQTLSADLIAVRNYFIGRSQEWAKYRKENVLDRTLDGTVLKLRLHGKLNFVNVDAATFNTLSEIELTGQPMGTLVINVAGNEVVPVATLTVRYKSKTDTGFGQELTFGRVLVNAFEAQSFTVADSAALHTSVLAPFAYFSAVKGELRGNIIAKDFSSGANVKSQPFGTWPNVLNGVKPTSGGGPKKWTVAGRNAVSCLFHSL